MIDISARNVRLRKMDTQKRACGLIAAFLATTKKEQRLIEQFLSFTCQFPSRCVTSKQVAVFRHERGIPKATLHVLLTHLERNEIIRKVPLDYGGGPFQYYVDENFGKVLYRTGRAYRKHLLPARRRVERPGHVAFLNAARR